jgi:preprotein translocase subunit YajC
VANLIILILPVAAIFVMFRAQKKRQQQAQQMQTALEPGSGVRTIGGMYALVKAINDETVELEIAPGVVVHYVKSAIAAVLEPAEYDAIINGTPVGDEPAEEAVTDEPADEPVKAAVAADADKSDSAGTDREAPESK